MKRQNAFPKPVLDRKLSVNGEATTLRDYLNANFYHYGIGKLTVNEVNKVVELEPGQSVLVAGVDVKRIS